MPEKRSDRDSRGRFLPKNKAALAHGAYAGKMTLAIRKGSSLARAALVQDLGPRECDLSAAEIILIDKAVNLLAVTTSIETWIRAHGIFKGRDLQPILDRYIAFVNSLRLCLRELGISKKTEETLDLGKYIAEKYGKEKAKDGQPEEKEQKE